jgi:hypothetical protein
MAMGDDQMMICCGDRCISLYELHHAVKAITQSLQQFSLVVGLEYLEEQALTVEIAINTILSMGQLRESAIWLQDLQSCTFLELNMLALSLAQQAMVTDVRDKVYGLLGLLPLKLASRIDRGDQNYLVSTDEIYLDFGKAIIEFTGELDILFAVPSSAEILSKID